MSVANTFTIEGELSIYRAAELAQALNAWLPAAAQAQGRVALNLSNVTEMDCAGLQLLLSAQRSAQALAVPFLLDAASNAVIEVLQLSALEHLAPTAPTH